MTDSESTGAPKRRTVLLIVGPTASGKSALAVAVAERLGGVVINADALQVYRDLEILTARPGRGDLDRAPHRLYGVLASDDPCDAQRWRDLAVAAIDAAPDQPAILVGGTGLYVKALTEGFSDMPMIPKEVRAQAARRRAQLGAAAFHAEVAGFDPELAAKRPPGDTQRLIRAWEVFHTTGEPFSRWAARPRAGAPAHLAFRFVVIDPPREALHARINGRFEAMLAAGALEEVAALTGLDPGLPIMKALGAPELLAVRAGTLSLAAATERAQAASRQYAKRQTTWFRHQIEADLRLETPEAREAPTQLIDAWTRWTAPERS